MLDKSKLGNRFTCYECGTKFYDLNRPAALCPECGADQAGAPTQDIRSLLSPNTPVVKDEDEPTEVDATADESSDTDFDEDDADMMDLGLDDLDEGGDDAGLLSDDLDDGGAEEI